MLRHRIIIGALTIFCLFIAVNYALIDDLSMTIWWGIGSIVEAILLSIVVLSDVNVATGDVKEVDSE